MDGERFLHVPADLDFSQGKRFQAEVLARLCSSVHHPSSSVVGSFFLLAIFRRFTFRLTEDSVSIALHSVLGGTPAGFHVKEASDRHFRFSVASKDVGLLVHSLKRVTTKHFDVYFFLWRDGGSNWEKDENTWLAEEAKQWTTVTRKKKRKLYKLNVSFPHNLVQSSPIRLAQPSFRSAKFVKPIIEPAGRAIKIGNILCPLASDDQNRFTPFNTAPSSRRSCIPVQQAFSSLKNSLGFPAMQPVQASTSHWLADPAQNRLHERQAYSVQIIDKQRSEGPTNSSISPFPTYKPASTPHKRSPVPSYLPHAQGEERRSDDTVNSVHAAQGGKWNQIQSKEILTKDQHSNQRDQHYQRNPMADSCYRCLTPGHYARECSSKIRCRYCYNYGHIERVCWKKKRDENRKWKQAETSKHLAQAQGPREEHLLHHSPVCQNKSQTARFSRDSSPSSEQREGCSSPLSLHSPTMANFPLNPMPFIAQELNLEDGGANRRSRGYIYLSGNAIRAHEEYVIAIDHEGILDPEDYGMFIPQIRHYIQNELRLDVKHGQRNPHGIGMFRLGSIYQRDILFSGNVHNIDGVMVRFIRHDRARNFRESHFRRIGWIILLGYPLDYRNLHHIDQTCSSFGKLVHWHSNPAVTAYVLVKCMYDNAEDVPRSLVIKQGEEDSGDGRTWTTPAYILNWEPYNQNPVQDDEIPPDGNPHPFFPVVQPGEAEQMEQLANQNLNQFQGDPAWEAAAQQANIDNGWPAWPPQANEGQNDVQNNDVQQNMEQQQQPQQQQQEIQAHSSDSSEASNPGSSESVNQIVQQGQGPQFVINQQADHSFVQNGQAHNPPEWVHPFISRELTRLLTAAFPNEGPNAWWNNADIVLQPLAMNLQLNVIQQNAPPQLLNIPLFNLGNNEPQAHQLAAHNVQIEEIIAHENIAQPEVQIQEIAENNHGLMINDIAVGMQPSNLNNIMAAKSNQVITKMYSRRTRKVTVKRKIITRRSTSQGSTNRSRDESPTHKTSPERILTDNQVLKPSARANIIMQGTDLNSQGENSTRQKSPLRKKLDSIKRKAKAKVQTPVESDTLRRSKRVSKLTDGYRATGGGSSATALSLPSSA
ncbi:hypothetical protein EJB05_15707, partial [Eragrostis curvula]